MWYIRNGLIQPLILEQRITVKDIRIQASIKYRERRKNFRSVYKISYYIFPRSRAGDVQNSCRMYGRRDKRNFERDIRSCNINDIASTRYAARGKKV